MGVIISDKRDKKEYYKNEADKLKRRAIEVEKAENYAEAKRLDNLADKAGKAADSYDRELKNYKK